MKDKNKNKELLKGKKFFEGIKFWHKQIAELGDLKSELKRHKTESEKFPQKLQSQLEIRTVAERMIIKQLHQEIEQRKKTERMAQDARNYAENIIDTVREPLIVLDEKLMVISANRSFYQVFKVKPEDTEKQYIYDLGNRQWDIPKLRELLEKVLPKVTSFDNFEVEHNFPNIGKRTMLLNARKIYRKTNHTQLILLSIEDITERKEAEDKLIILANCDGLTGCVNFRSVMEFLENEINRSKRYQKKFTLIMIDIDQLKRINDEYGHAVGNDALVAFANVIKNSVRSIDIVGRYGGDEFMVILPETDSQDALAVLERIRNDLNQIKIASPYVGDVKELTLRFSAGIAVFPYNAKDLKELIWAADGALRQAKREGKNRVVLERRRFTRVNPLQGISTEVAGSSGKENIKDLKISNISKQGMLLLSTQDILDEEFICRVHPPKGGSAFESICKVKHKSSSENGLYRIGVYSPDTPESFAENLSS
jgi:diguanylate cyclase (GGDEF)-like protein/PAS domain S-box-containing protein